MDITIIGTGFIGSTLGRALSHSGHRVTFGSRHPGDAEAPEATAAVTTIGEALSRSDVVILALPAAAVAELTADHGDGLAGKLVIDATNRMGAPVANARASLQSPLPRPAGRFQGCSIDLVGGPTGSQRPSRPRGVRSEFRGG